MCVGVLLDIVKDIRKLFLACEVRSQFAKLQEVKKVAYKKKHRLPIDEPLSLRAVCCLPFTVCCNVLKCQYCPCDFKAIFASWLSNTLFNRLFYFFIGLGLTWILFGFMFYYAQLSRTYCITMGLSMLFILTFGLSFSPKIRLLTIIALPTLTSRTGRVIILGVVFVLVYRGPAVNLVFNVVEIGRSISCGHDEAKKEVNEFGNEALEPVRRAGQFFASVRDSLNTFARRVNDQWRPVADAVQAVGTEMRKMFSYFNGLNTSCRLLADRADDICRVLYVGTQDYFNEFFNKIFTRQNFFCKAYKMCDALRVAKEKIEKAVKDTVDPYVERTRREFSVDVQFDRNYTYRANSSKTYREVFREVGREVGAKLSWLNVLGNVLQALSYLMPFVIILLSYLYLKSYLKKEHFDNNYINSHMLDIDIARAKLGKETILPLSWKERATTIDPTSLRLTAFEFRKLVIASAFFMVSATNAAFYIFLDYALWWVMSLFILVESQVNYEAPRPPQMTVTTIGNSSTAQMYREVGASLSNTNTTLEVREEVNCRPQPSEPDFDGYRQIFSLLLFALISVITEAYTLRLRNIACNYFYPVRAKTRAAWLYNQVIQRRGSFLRFLKKQIQHQAGYTNIEKVSLMDRLSAVVPCIAACRRIAGHKAKFCLTCGKQGALNDKLNFKHCDSTANCTGIYCVQCVQDIENVCSVCTEPIEPVYGESDGSEEMDSSEEESDYYDEEYCDDPDRATLLPLRNKMRKMGRTFLMDGIRKPAKNSNLSDDEDFPEEDITEGIYDFLEKELQLERVTVDQMRDNARLVLRRTCDQV